MTREWTDVAKRIGAHEKVQYFDIEYSVIKLNVKPSSAAKYLSQCLLKAFLSRRIFSCCVVLWVAIGA